MTSLTKSELARCINKRCTKLTQDEVKVALDTVFATINDALACGVRVHLPQFGVFNVKRRNARHARNPKNGAPVYVPEKYVPFFHAGMMLAQRIRTSVDEKSQGKQ